MKVIEAVIALGLSRRLLLTGNCFLKLTFLVFGIQKPDIFQRMYVFLFPTGKYFVCILETWLAGGENSTAAGFLDQFRSKP